MATRKSTAEKQREAAAATPGGAADPGTDPQPSDQKAGDDAPITQEGAQATEAVSPQEELVEGAATGIHDALLALEQTWAAVPLVESQRRPDLANLDVVAERLDAVQKAVEAERKRLKKANA